LPGCVVDSGIVRLSGEDDVMHPAPTPPPISDKRHRFPAEIISQCVWRYHRFGLRLRDVQDLLAERGLAVTYETIHPWGRKVGPASALALRRRRPRPGDKWHVDEVPLKINGQRHWLWRAVDQDGMVLDILVQARRNQQAAERVLRLVLDGGGTRPVSSSPISWPASRRLAAG
jgi:putative transposase